MRGFVYLFMKVVLLLVFLVLFLFVLRVDAAFMVSIVREEFSWWTLNFALIIVCSTISLYPFGQTIWQSFRLVKTFEQKEKPFVLLKQIEKSSFVFGIVMTLVLPFVYLFVEVDDSPGFLLLYILFAFSGYFFSAFAYVLKDAYK